MPFSLCSIEQKVEWSAGRDHDERKEGVFSDEYSLLFASTSEPAGPRLLRRDRRGFLFGSEVDDDLKELLADRFVWLNLQDAAKLLFTSRQVSQREMMI